MQSSILTLQVCLPFFYQTPLGSSGYSGGWVLFEPAGDNDRHEQSLFFVCLVAYATLSSCQHRYLINIIENEFKERSFQNDNLFYLFQV